MSSTSALSLRIHSLRAGQNFLTEEPIRVRFKCVPGEKVNRPPNYLSELLLHLHMIGQVPLSILSIGDQEVDVTVKPEVFAKDRAEDTQLYNPPLLAEIADRL